MYAGVANQSLKTLSDINQQMADEQYNKKIAAMQLLQQAITTNDPTLRRMAEERSTGSGVLGAVDKLRTMFTPTNDIIKTDASLQSAGGNVPRVNPILQNNIAGQADRDQRKLLMDGTVRGIEGKVNDEQMKFILADKKYRAENNGERLTPEMYKQLYGNTEKYGTSLGNIDGKVPIYDDKAMSGFTNNDYNKQELSNQLADEKAIAKEDIATTKQNKDITQGNANANAKADATYAKNNSYINRLKDKGVYHEEFKGNIQEMSGQNRSMFKELYKQAIESGDYDKIAEIRDEYAENQRGINQYWKNDSPIDVSMFKDPRGKGAGWKKIMYTPKFEGSLNFSETPVETEIPANLHTDIEIFNYLNSILPKGSKMAEWRRGKIKVENTAGTIDNAKKSADAAYASGTPIMSGEEELGRTVKMSDGSIGYIKKGNRNISGKDEFVADLKKKGKNNEEIATAVVEAGF